MDHASLAGGFSDPPHQSADAFRAVMQAMARPGRIYDLGGAVPPAPLSIAAGTVIMTLCDSETGMHLVGGYDVPEVRDWITFHTGAPLVGHLVGIYRLGLNPMVGGIVGEGSGEVDYILPMGP